MSGTRSPFQREPVTEALIVSHGQPSCPVSGEAQLQLLTQQIRSRLPDWHIRSATLAAPGKFERELRQCGGIPFLYPVFMADGWFTKKALPERTGGREVRQLSPLGLHPMLPHRTVKLLKQEAERRGWSLNSCDVMVAAHGSETGPAAADCALYFAKRVRALMPFKKKIHTGFLAQEPFLSRVAQVSTPRTLLLPFLAGTGSHLTEDIPDALAEGGFKGVLLPAVGEADFIADLIAHSLGTAWLKANNFDPVSQHRTVEHQSAGVEIDAETVAPGMTDHGITRCDEPSRGSHNRLRVVASLLKKLQNLQFSMKRQAA